MRITKLHLLLFFLLAGAGIYGAYFWREKQAQTAKETEAKSMNDIVMQKRAEELGGELDIVAAPQKGTRILLRFTI